LHVQTIVKVAVNVPLSRLFDYTADTPPPAGCRVRVPFGRGTRVGVVMQHATSSDVEQSRLKALIEVLDEEPVLTDDDLRLIRFAADYYHHPIGEVVAAALPVALKQGRALYSRIAVFRALPGDAASLSRAPKQKQVFDAVAKAGTRGLSADVLEQIIERWRPAARALIERGRIERVERDAEDEADPPCDPVAGPPLNAHQRSAVRRVAATRGFDAFVLDGVTGSGKTEVYLHLIERALAEGLQALVLVPEIGLTPQLVDRFRRRLGLEPAVLHSGLTDSERLASWRRVRSGAAKLTVGTRSAVFVPMPQPGIIIVDEEHDGSLKQQEGFRYSARDLAITRAKHANVPIVLGSATPSLELLAHCRAGRFQHLTLPERAGGAEPPRIHLVDLNRDPANEGLSTGLLNAMDRHLKDGGQVLLFLNRRGFAPTLICSACGHIAGCLRCDARMTVHARESRLRCHHCGASRSMDTSCSECGADMRPLGEGTERIEDALLGRYPDKAIRRIDSDSVQRKGAIGEALAAATQGKADILVGTQMLSKGHHFPNLTLVGVVNADQGLLGTDFRSAERLAQTIVQVAGRAGRESRRGDVLIQTAYPTHRFWQRLIEDGYAGIAGDELREREAFAWPPFSRLALVRASAHASGDAFQFLNIARRRFEAFSPLEVLGPVDAPMAKRAGRFRVHLLLRSNDRSVLQRALRTVRPWLEDLPEGRKVRWSVDVDPIDLL